MNSDLILKAAITAVVALSGLIVTSTSLAANEGKEQCAGIAKAGQNDCATSTNACHGHATADQSAEAWIYLPKGTCERIIGGRVVNVKDPTPEK